MIAGVHLTRRFGARIAVEDVSLAVERGEIVALVGPNGAGKTTTMRMLAGLIAPSGGTVTLDGVPVTPRTAGAARGRIGFLTEAPGLWDRLTVIENLRTYAKLHQLADPDGAAMRVLDRLGLADRARTRAAELSKGMRQKVAIARSVLHDPPVLLLDEPTSGLDPQVAREVRSLIEERRAAGGAILVSTHNLAEVERLADRVAVLRTRLLAFERPSALQRLPGAARVLVRVGGAMDSALQVARSFDAGAAVDGGALTLTLAAESETPALVRALVAAAVDVVEVRALTADLEDAYLRVVRGAGERP